MDDDVREHLEATMAMVEKHRQHLLATSGRSGMSVEWVWNGCELLLLEAFGFGRHLCVLSISKGPFLPYIRYLAEQKRIADAAQLQKQRQKVLVCCS